MRNWIRTTSIAGLAASYFVMGHAMSQQAPPVLPPPATVSSVDVAASRMRAGLQLLNDERAAAENRAIQTQAELDKAQADLDGANARLNQEIAKNQALQKQLDGLKPKSESAPAADIPPLPAGVKPIP